MKTYYKPDEVIRYIGMMATSKIFYIQNNYVENTKILNRSSFHFFCIKRYLKDFVK